MWGPYEASEGAAECTALGTDLTTSIHCQNDVFTSLKEPAVGSSEGQISEL